MFGGLGRLMNSRYRVDWWLYSFRGDVVSSLFGILVFSMLGIWGVSEGWSLLRKEGPAEHSSQGEPEQAEEGETRASRTHGYLRVFFGAVCFALALYQLISLFAQQDLMSR